MRHHLNPVLGILLVAALLESPCASRAYAQVRTAVSHAVEPSTTSPPASQLGKSSSHQPPSVKAHHRFLAQRGTPPHIHPNRIQPAATPFSTSAPLWTSTGPLGVLTPSYGLVTGRLSSIAFDPSDSSGNHLFLGTTGGGLWKSQNAASNPSSVEFQPLTDNLPALSGVPESGLSVGAVSVQPGGTGVILAGLGDPNDALDSYYGAGLLRSTDNGSTWTLIQHSVDLETSQGTQDFWFTGEGFAAFAWSTSSTQTVVAAVSQAWEGTIVNADLTNASYEGLYYSQDAGVTWHLSQITDLDGQDVQGPLDPFALPDGNAATSVVWNPVRQLFIAAIRYHGYYSSPDGVSWTQLSAQPGPGFTPTNCPTEAGSVGVAGCPIFRGTLSVNPITGDTFAWSVDAFNQDQGIWQDQCAISLSGVCSNPTITFATQLNTAPLEISDENGPATIPNGDYNLALAAVPAALAQGEDTLLFAGANDLWKCSLANSCPWRNTTNSTTCFSAAIAEYQHAIAWSPSNPSLLFLGNDSGLWRSTDQVAESGSPCAPTDASHFQNLNASIGSLDEVGFLAQSKSTAATLLAGLGPNGFAAVVNTPASLSAWNQVLSGEGGPVAVDPSTSANSWYVNNSAGVSILHCSSSTACTPASFGTTPNIGETQVQNDGLSMGYPAAFRLDLLDPTQVLVATCRLWRGPSSGSGWTAANAISPTFDGTQGAVGNACNGNALIRSIAVARTPSGEILYVAMAGSADGGSIVAGHIFSANISTSGVVSAWTDLAFSPVTNDSLVFNAFGFDVSSIALDPHDPSGNTLYVTVSGFADAVEPAQTLYSSTNGGQSWTAITANLPNVPANSVVVDTQDSNTVYVALDTGVYSTRAVSTCPTTACWAPYGSGLPSAPVTQLLVDPPGAAGPESGQALTAATYGRGIWQIPMASAGAPITTVGFNPSSLNFGSVTIGVSGPAQNITLKNTGVNPLTITAIAVTGASPFDYSVSGTCAANTFQTGATCTIAVTFSPTAAGSRPASLAISLNVIGGELLIPLTGTGLAPANISLLPATLAFGNIEVGLNSPTQAVSIQNTGGSTVSLGSIAVSAPFVKGTATCGNSLPANTACAVNIGFAPKSAAAFTGSLTVTDSLGTQSAILTGTGINGPTDTLSTNTIAFPATVIGQSASPLAVTITNSGGLPLTQIGISVSANPGTPSSNFTAITNCGSQLAPNSSCSVTVTFSPTVARFEAAVLVISDAIHAQQVSLTGTGLKPPIITLSASSLNFGSIQVNTPGSPKLLTISNTGGSPLTLPGFALSGSAAASFAVSNTTGATACGLSIPANANCQLQIVFTPLAIGAAAATLTITTSAPGVASASTTLTGTGLSPPILEVLPPVLNFGPVTLGFSSGLFTVQVVNAGQEPMQLPTFALSGAQAADFSLSAPTDIAPCTGQLNPGSLCNIQITFSPSAIGMESATLTVTAQNAIPPTATVSLAGIGMPVILLQSDPAALTFPATIAGQTSAPLTLAISNLGKKKANNLAFAFNGPYQLSTAQTTCGNTLASGAFCNLGVTFAPTLSGDEPGSITVSVTNTGVAPLLIPLDGSGIAVGGILPSPTQMTFGSVVVQTTSLPQTLTITNSGQADVDGLAIAVNGDFALTANQCPTVLPAPVCSGSVCTAQSCNTGVVFTPSTTGNRLGSLTISSTSAGVLPAVVTLTGSGNPQGSLSLSPPVTSFGSLTVGLTSAPQTVTVTNASGVGASNLTGVQFAVLGDFSLIQNSCGTQIPIGATCAFSVAFSPTQAGTRIGSIIINSTTPGFLPVVEGLSGLALPAAQLHVSPGFLQFGGIAVGLNSPAQNLTLTNPGTASLQGLSITAPAPFSAGTGTCNSTLPPASSCTIPVIFAPTNGGLVSSAITILSSSAGVPPISEPVSGTGILPPTISLSPRTLSFPATTETLTAPPQSVLVSNTGSLPLTGLGIAIAGTAAADFASSSTCTPNLASGAGCSVLITFTPTRAGGRTAVLTASSTMHGVASISTSLSGIGLTPGQIVVSPTGVAFPSTLLGSLSPTRTIAVLNSGQTNITDLALFATSNFKLDPAQTTCTALLPPQQKCIVGVLFDPSVAGPITGDLTLNSPQATREGSTPATVALSGAGALPPAILTSAPVAVFPLTGIHQPAAPFQLTITNQGNLAPLTALALSVNHAASAAGFSLSASNCGHSLGAGASCTATIAFSPAAIGTLGGSLTISAANAAPVSIPLTGIGYDFTMAFVGTGSIAVLQGQTAYYSIAITPLAGVTGALGSPFSFQCSGLPANSLCLFDPPQLGSLPANVSGDITAAIGTGGPTANNANLLSRKRGSAQSSHATQSISLLGVIVLIPILFFTRRCLARSNPNCRSGRSSSHLLLLTSLLLATSFALIGCGLTSCASANQSGGNLHGTKGTPTGTYTIQIIATSSAVQHTIALTLRVN